MNHYVNRLKDMVELEGLSDHEVFLCNRVLDDRRFHICPGGVTRHHTEEGGLARHTFEVARGTCWALSSPRQRQLGLIAAIFHDFGKVYAYEKCPEDGTWVKQPFEKLIGHLVWSWAFFQEQACIRRMDQQDIEAIGHAMLAHHGRLEWRSPVEPQTPLAWALHSADMMSMQNAGGEGKK